MRSEAADGGARGSLNYLVSPTFPCPEAENDEEREKMNISYDNTTQMLIQGKKYVDTKVEVTFNCKLIL